MVYIKDMRPDLLYTLQQRPDMRVQPNDRLRIVVSSRNPELTAPFNMGVGGYEINSTGEVRTTVSSTMQERGFLVNRQGEIEFPILGFLKVEGLTTQEIANQIRIRLRDERQVPDAMVSVEILNFKITFIGEIGSPGIMTIPEERRLSLLEAIIMAGGFTLNAAMDEVAVIREEKRGLRMYMNDISTVEVFDSPTFYLQQNDIVYIKPKAAQPTLFENRTFQWYGYITGASSLILSLMLLLNYTK
jgi:polysaccharide export outer membrane protein